jgi:hypothetical protein
VCNTSCCEDGKEAQMVLGRWQGDKFAFPGMQSSAILSKTLKVGRHGGQVGGG